MPWRNYAELIKFAVGDNKKFRSLKGGIQDESLFHRTKLNMFKLDIPYELIERKDKLRKLLFENGEALKSVFTPSELHIYMVDYLNRRINMETKIQSEFTVEKLQWKLDEPSIVAAFVARTCTVVLASPIFGDSRFPDGIPWKFRARSVLCLPVLSIHGACVGVIELYRENQGNPFTLENMKLANVVVGCMGAYLSFPDLRESTVRGNQALLHIHQSLLELRSSFSDHETAEEVICSFLTKLKEFLAADRISLYLYEYEENESTPSSCSLYDDGLEIKGCRNVVKKSLNIPYSEDIGTAWYATQEKTSINLKDAYADPRFSNKEDLFYNYKTHSLWTFPIIFMDIVRAAVSVANKKDAPYFTPNDEFISNLWADYFILIIQYYMQRDNLENIERKCHEAEKMVLSLLHPSDEMVERMLPEYETLKVPKNFCSLSWYPSEEDSLPLLSVYMLADTLDKVQAKDIHKLMRFVLTAQNSYRSLPFHNFEHAMLVTHTSYVIIKKNKDMFSPIEEAAFVISSLCHDSDHLGVSNSFLQLTKHVLSQLYESSPLENHHFELAVAFIHKVGLFDHWSKKDFNLLMNNVKNNILSTDLAVFFETRNVVLRLQRKKAFHLNSNKHRMLLKRIVMNGCDLSANGKPFAYSKGIAHKISEEFYLQGDREKEMGFSPASIMNRDLAFRLPEEQINFHSVIALPCFSLLASLIPNTRELQDGSLEAQRLWKVEVQNRRVNEWKWEESYVKEDDDEDKDNEVNDN